MFFFLIWLISLKAKFLRFIHIAYIRTSFLFMAEKHSIVYIYMYMDFPGGSDGKASAYNAGDLRSIPGLGRSPGKENGNPLQYSCLEKPMDGGAWRATVHRIAELDTTERLHFLSFFSFC